MRLTLGNKKETEQNILKADLSLLSNAEILRNMVFNVVQLSALNILENLTGGERVQNLCIFESFKCISNIPPWGKKEKKATRADVKNILFKQVGECSFYFCTDEFERVRSRLISHQGLLRPLRESDKSKAQCPDFLTMGSREKPRL